MPFPNAALDQPINAEMDHRETGADTHLDVLSVKLATYTLPAVGTTAMGVDRLDAQLQLPILTLSLAGRALHLSVVAAGRYPQDSAHHSHRVGPLRVNELESHSLSFAKKAAAFFKEMSRPLLNLVG